MIRDRERLLRALEAHFRCELPVGSVARVDPHRRGGRVLEVELGGATHWLLERGGELASIQLEDDEELPYARALNGARADGRVRLLSWRPGRRATMLRCDDGQPFVVKAYRSGRAERAAAAHRNAATGSSGEGFRVPALRAVDDARSAAVMERLEGARLDFGKDPGQVAFQVGVALRSFQESGELGGLARHGAHDELAVIDGLAARLQPVLSGLPEPFERVRRRLAEAESALMSTELLRSHGDLHDGQFLLLDEGLGLIDFDLLCAADPVRDAANLSAHFSLRALQGRCSGGDRDAEVAAEALLEGLDRGDEPGFDERLRFYQCATFLRLALVYAARPRWSAIVSDLAELSWHCADELP